MKCALRAWLVLALSAAGGCGGDGDTQLLVVMDTDYDVPAEMNRIRARVLRVVDGGEIESWQHTFALDENALPGEPKFKLPASFGVAPQDDRDVVVVELTALAQSSETPLVTRRSKTGFLKGKHLWLPMFLHRACAEVQCVMGQTCGCAAGTNCAEPTCIEEFIPPNRLVPVDDPDMPPAGADAGPDAAMVDAGRDAAVEDAGHDAAIVDAGPTGDASMDAEPPNCEAPRQRCDQQCVELQSDDQHCGRCDRRCEEEQICVVAECVTPPSPGIETISPARVFPSLALGVDGTPHLLFVGRNRTDDLTYARAKPDGSWTFVTIESTLFDDQQPALAHAPDGYSYVPFFDSSGGQSCAVIAPDGTLSVEPVADAVSPIPDYHAAAIQPNNEPAFAFYNGQLWYSYRSGGVWHTELVETENGDGVHPSLAIGRDGIAHLFYYAHNDQELRHAERRSVGGWSIETVDDSGDVGYYSSVAIDGDDILHVAYQDIGASRLKYARGRRGGWTVAQASTDNAGYFNSLALDPTGRVYVSSWKGTTQTLRLHRLNEDGSWTVRNIDDRAGWSSLVIDRAAFIHLAFIADGALRYLVMAP